MCAAIICCIQPLARVRWPLVSPYVVEIGRGGQYSVCKWKSTSPHLFKVTAAVALSLTVVRNAQLFVAAPSSNFKAPDERLSGKEHGWGLRSFSMPLPPPHHLDTIKRKEVRRPGTSVCRVHRKHPEARWRVLVLLCVGNFSVLVLMCWSASIVREGKTYCNSGGNSSARGLIEFEAMCRGRGDSSFT